MTKGAIFDQDGLLFDTEVIFENCWKQVGAELGLDVTDAFAHACCGCSRAGLQDVVRRFFPAADGADYVERARLREADGPHAMPGRVSHLQAGI